MGLGFALVTSIVTGVLFSRPAWRRRVPLQEAVDTGDGQRPRSRGAGARRSVDLAVLLVGAGLFRA
jgi:hypothetical protein